MNFSCTRNLWWKICKKRVSKLQMSISLFTFICCTITEKIQLSKTELSFFCGNKHGGKFLCTTKKSLGNRETTLIWTVILLEDLLWIIMIWSHLQNIHPEVMMYDFGSYIIAAIFSTLTADSFTAFCALGSRLLCVMPWLHICSTKGSSINDVINFR